MQLSVGSMPPGSDLPVSPNSKSRTDTSSSGSAGGGVSDEWDASCLSRLTFGWLFPLIKLGHQRPLVEADIGPNVERDGVSGYLPGFEATLKAGSRETLRASIWRTFSHNERKGAEPEGWAARPSLVRRRAPRAMCRGAARAAWRRW